MIKPQQKRTPQHLPLINFKALFLWNIKNLVLNKMQLGRVSKKIEGAANLHIMTNQNGPQHLSFWGGKLPKLCTRMIYVPQRAKQRPPNQQRRKWEQQNTTPNRAVPSIHPPKLQWSNRVSRPIERTQKPHPLVLLVVVVWVWQRVWLIQLRNQWGRVQQLLSVRVKGKIVGRERTYHYQP